MLDTLLTVAMLALPARPAMVRTPALVAPDTGKPSIVQVASVKAPALVTTCYINSDNTCWTERN